VIVVRIWAMSSRLEVAVVYIQVMARRRPHVLLTLSPDAIRRLDELVAAVRADGQRCSRSALVEWLVLGAELRQGLG
jgi:hypothetical protein